MRNLVLFMHLSVDGFCATPDGGLEWIPYNDALQQYAQTIVDSVGSPVYGRITYEMMEKYWQWATVQKDPAASAHDRKHTKWLEQVEKIVVSKTIKQPDWNNTTVISDNIAQTFITLKKKPGKDLVIFGSPTLAYMLIDLELIDAYQFTISPVILGSGKTVFKELKDKQKLTLIHAQPLQGGIIGLEYRRTV